MYNRRWAQDSPAILCVDDEPAVVDGLRRNLGFNFRVVGASCAEEGLAQLGREQKFAAIISDMRMPRTDGVTFLREASAIQPSASRILFTGQADVPSAVAAVNEGGIFRFLLKPCPPDLLVRAVWDAVRQNELIEAERELLDRTLRETLGAMAEALGLVAPKAAYPLIKVRRLARILCRRLQIERAWEIEVACMFSHVATLTLPEELLTPSPQTGSREHDALSLLGRGNVVAQRLTAQIPRLGPVRDLLRHAGRLVRTHGDAAESNQAWIVAACASYGRCLAAGLDQDAALAFTKEQSSMASPELLECLEALSAPPCPNELRPVSFEDLRPGMVLAEAVYMKDGVLLISADTEVNNPLIERLRNFATANRLVEPLIVRDSEDSRP